VSGGTFAITMPTQTNPRRELDQGAEQPKGKHECGRKVRGNLSGGIISAAFVLEKTAMMMQHANAWNGIAQGNEQNNNPLNQGHEQPTDPSEWNQGPRGDRGTKRLQTT